MSQYFSDSFQRFYQSTFDYAVPQNNFIPSQTQRSFTSRQSSINRNNNVSSSLIFKSSKIQQNIGGKIRRQNSMKNSMEFKENDPYSKNSQPQVHTSKIPFARRDQNDMSSQYDSKNLYCNPLGKRQKLSKDLSRQKVLDQQQTRQNLNQNIRNSYNNKNSFYKQQYQHLNQKILKIETQVKENTGQLAEHWTKIEKLEEFYLSQSRGGKKKHSRSNSNNPTPTFKQLADIMSLIEESKNYQIKNSEEYRKMIEQFRATILQFREELNKTPKRQELDSQIQKIKENINEVSLNMIKKSSHELSASQSLLNKPKEIETIEKIQKDLARIKTSVEKLDQSNTSLRADLVKFNVRDKKMNDQINLVLVEMTKKIQSVEKQVVPFGQRFLKKGPKHEGTAICFKVCQQLKINSNEARKQFSPFRFSYGPLEDYEQGQKLDCLTLNQKTYYIDKEGNLLDKDSFYLLNERNEQLRLSPKQIQTLRKLNVLE